MLILATKNKGKILEIQKSLQHIEGLEIKGLNDWPEYDSPVENGKTFEANALIKLHAVKKYLGDRKNTWILADDSGLVCPGLDGLPGVDSAYYAGPKATDEENNQKLVSEISKLPESQRSACYVCVLALMSPQGEISLIREECAGEIVTKAKGQGGFGYDPYFFLADLGKTMAEITLEEKNLLSHRGKAILRIGAILQ